MTTVNRQNEFKFSKKISPFEMIIQKNDFKISKSQSQWFSPVTFTIIKITCNSLKIFIFTLKVKKIIYFYQCFFRNRNIIRKSNSLVYLSVNTRNREVNSLLKKHDCDYGKKTPIWFHWISFPEGNKCDADTTLTEQLMIHYLVMCTHNVGCRLYTHMISRK